MKSRILISFSLFALCSCGEASEFDGQSLTFICSGEEIGGNKAAGFGRIGTLPKRTFYIDVPNKTASFSNANSDKRFPVCGFEIASEFKLKDNMLNIAGKIQRDNQTVRYCSYDIDLKTGKSSLMTMNEKSSFQGQTIFNMECEKK